MAKKQTRRAISIRGVTYAEVRAHCDAGGESMSEYIERIIAADKVMCLLPETGSDEKVEREIVRLALACCEERDDAAFDSLNDQFWSLAHAYSDRLKSGTPASAPVYELRRPLDADRARQPAAAPVAARPKPPTAAPVTATAATAAPAQRGAATTAELRALVTEEANRLIPRLPTGYSAEDLEVAGRAAAAEAVRTFNPGNGVHLVDAARPLVRRAMTDRLRDLREEATAAPAPTATATAKPAAAKPAPVVATAAGATTTAARPPATAGTSPTATSSPTTARAIRRPGFHSKGGSVSVSQRAWEWLEQQSRPVSVHDVAAAIGASMGAVTVACRSFLLRGFLDGHPQAYRVAADPKPSQPRTPAAPPRAAAPAASGPACPCCGGKSLGPGMRCGACVLGCRPDGAGGWRRGEGCPAAAAADVEPPSPLPRESSIKAGPPPEQTTMLGREATPPPKAAWDQTGDPRAAIERYVETVKGDTGASRAQIVMPASVSKRVAQPCCPCCGRATMRSGARCGTCAISCRRDGDGWKRGKMCPAGNRVVEVLEPLEDEDHAVDDEVEPIEEIEERPPLRRAPAGFRPALRPPPPIPEGRNATVSQGRPAGARVEPAKQRSVEDTKKLVKVDPIAAVHAGRAGVQF